jgi:hypothetical protein
MMVALAGENDFINAGSRDFMIASFEQSSQYHFETLPACTGYLQ